MCLIGTAMKVHPDFPFIIAANRDEFIHRPALEADFWEENFIAGKDISQGGTWIGISADGRIAAVTNVRDPDEGSNFPYSRGMLVPAWLKQKNMDEYFSKKHLYGGFNFLYGTKDQLQYVTNKKSYSQTLKKGIYTLSNADLYTSWPKTACLSKDMKKLMNQNKKELIEGLFHSLSRASYWPEGTLPDTGIGKELEKKLSPAFVSMEEYGTRCSTVILIDNHNVATFIERSFRPQKKEVCYQMQLPEAAPL